MTAADQIFAAATQIVGPALREAAARLDPANRRIADYHLGFTDAEGGPLDATGGKGVRGALALLSAATVTRPSVEGAAAGGEGMTWSRAGLAAAVAVELIHQSSLLHDDIIDTDEVRRHRPAAWTVFGPSETLLAGNAMMMLATEILGDTATDLGPARAATAMTMLASATRRMLAGQAADIAFETDPTITLARCQAMVADKTGALLACAASLGATLAGAPAATIAALGSYGHRLGMAFQLVDDLLGIWGEPARTGKPVAADLLARKKSLPVVAALAAGGPHADRLAAVYASAGDLTPADLAAATDAIEAAGGRTWAQVEADRHTAAALEILAELDLPTRVHTDFVTITEALGSRDR